MEQFSLEKWLQDKSRKIVTRRGNQVRIICTDRKHGGDTLPIVFLEESPDGIGEFLLSCRADGTCDNYYTPYDLFFADEENTNKILDELKSYLEKTPKEQIEKDWKEIQDWYSQHFTNEKHNEKEKLTEFEQYIKTLLEAFGSQEGYRCNLSDESVKKCGKELLDLARKEIEKENSGFKPKFTYNEKDYSELGNKLIEFRNNTPLCSVSYRDGEGRNVILHYEKEIFELVKNEILKDLPKWKN